MYPTDWRVCSLRDVTEKVMVGIASAATHAYCSSGIPMLRNLNIRPGYIDEQDVLQIDPAFEASHKNKRLKAGDVLVVRTGYPGVSAVVPEAYEGAQCFTSLIVRPKKAELSADYFAQYMNSAFGEQLSAAAEAGGAQKNLNAGELEKLQLSLPTIREQARIAEVLSTWDQAISTAEQVVANCQRQRLGLTQTLIGDHSRQSRGEAVLHREHASAIFLPRSVRRNDDLELLSVMQDVGVVPRNSLDRKVVMPEGSTDGYKLVEPGDFVISLRSFEGGLEYSRFRGLVSPAYTVLKPAKPIVDDFYRHYFKSQEFIGRLAVAVIGIRDGKQISYDDFEFLRLPNPPISEQQAIADVLNAAEQAVKHHESHLQLLHQEKAALMSQLLTGKRRVKLPEAEIESQA